MSSSSHSDHASVPEFLRDGAGADAGQSAAGVAGSGGAAQRDDRVHMAVPRIPEHAAGQSGAQGRAYRSGRSARRGARSSAGSPAMRNAQAFLAALGNVLSHAAGGIAQRVAGGSGNAGSNAGGNGGRGGSRPGSRMRGGRGPEHAGGARVRMLKSRTYTRRRIAVAVLGFVLLVELFQIFWPSDRFYPLATLDGHAVGGQTAAQVTDRLNADTAARNVVLTDQSTHVVVTLAAKDAGIKVDYTARAAQAAKHSFLGRIIPFSWLFVHNTTSDDLPNAFDTATEPVKADVRNAGATAQGGALVTVPAAEGYSFNPGDVRSAAGASFAAKPEGDLAAATLNLNIVKPTVATATADQLVNTVNAGLGAGVTFTYGDGNWTVSASDLASTIDVTVDGQDNTKLVAAVNAGRLNDVLKSKGVALGVAQKAAANGAIPQVLATEARASRAIDTTATAEAFTAMINSGKNAPVAVTEHKITNAALYTDLPTEGSIEDKLKQLFGNATYEVAVYDLKTGESKLQINADGVLTSASTYKLYIAYAMINAVETGKLTWNSPLNGTTLNTCLTRMIINSDNACPEAWLNTYGFGTVTEQAHAIGAKNTNFSRGNMRTTPNDLATVLKGYYNNTIATKASTDKLFQLMQTQEYRDGIPAGIGSDGVVQDKVGFLGSLLHDAAIVRCDKGDYAMVIMTDHASWTKIAQASLLIYDEL
ncbi:serine hydrolase [Bifidobacterium vespertilionis]|uniref:serine hydrolase n=1 Tax=Bifidobacterium vespertilionis TaxID=2562524 RepID=UPI0030B84324